MYISKIVLKNFKSFGKKTEIPFYSGFTVITGPNGSGKSNVIDSILFCLGLSTSTKQLRADRLTDLIHNGKKDAEVSIFFSDNGKSYEVTRKVKVTEKGYYSYYYLNGKPVNLSEIHDFLSQFGVYSDAYNIVMQGDVTRIIEMSPLQRRKIIDDVAGISEFDEKRDRALEELERVRENIEKLEAVIAEVNSRLAVLERDKNEALKYKELLKKKDEYESYLTAHEFLLATSIKEKLERDIEKLERQKDALAERIPELIRQISDVSNEIESIASKISQLGDERESEIQSRILELTSELQSIRNSEKFYVEELERIDSEIVKVLGDISKLKDELSKVDAEIEEYTIKRIQVGEIVDELQSKMNDLRKKLERVDRQYRELKDELVEKRSQLDRLKEERSALLRERDKIVEVLRRIELEIDELETENGRLRDETEALKREIKEKRDEMASRSDELQSVQQKLTDVDKELFSIRAKIADVEDQMRKYEVELAKVKAKLSALQTYSKSVEILLEARNRRELPGIFGTVAQLGEVDEEYINAIEAAAGNALQFVVVETEDDAVEAIKYLKAVQGGRATFIPLRKIKNFTIKFDKSVLKEPGVIDFAVNLVRCEKKFQPVFRFILRDTIVVDTIDTARRLMDRGFRIVTLDGDIVEKSGLMSGGSREKRRILISRELLEKEQELTEKIFELQKKKEELFYELNTAEELRRAYKGDVERLNSIIDELTRDIEIAEERLKDLSERLKENVEKVAQKKIEKEEKSKTLKVLSSRITQIDDTISSLLSEIEGIEKKLKGSEIPKIMEELEGVKDRYVQNKEVLSSIEKKLELLDLRRRQIENTISEKEEQVSELKFRKEELERSINEGRRKVEEIDAELKRLKDESTRLSKELRGLRERRDELISTLRKLEDEKGRVEFEIEKLEDRIQNQKEKLQYVLDELEKFGDVKVPENLPPKDEVIKILGEIERELEKFGDVNLKAIQEYEEVRKRRDELTEKKLILERERRDIIERIERYERRKREVFFEVFTAINRNFAEIIRELASGEGELYLDGDDPFSSGLHIRVKPYNKPVQKLESMSGGEKSLVALALIFAIQMYKPAPFYAFDEVDMFLDGVNVSRVAKMIKKRSKDAQFIVVSLRKPMLENADAIVGVTLGRDNSSVVTGVKLRS